MCCVLSFKYSGHHRLFQHSPVPGWPKSSPHSSTLPRTRGGIKDRGCQAHCISHPRKAGCGAGIWGCLKPGKRCSPLVSSMGFRCPRGHHCPWRKAGKHLSVVIMEKLIIQLFSLKKIWSYPHHPHPPEWGKGGGSLRQHPKSQVKMPGMKVTHRRGARGPGALQSGILPLPPVQAAIVESRWEQMPYREVLWPTHNQWDHRAIACKLQPPPRKLSTKAEATTANRSNPGMCLRSWLPFASRFYT